MTRDDWVHAVQRQHRVSPVWSEATLDQPQQRYRPPDSKHLELLPPQTQPALPSRKEGGNLRTAGSFDIMPAATYRLRLHKIGVDTIESEQLGMRALFNHLAALHDTDAVCQHRRS